MLRLFVFLVWAGTAGVGTAGAQTASPTDLAFPRPQILTLDQDALFSRSQFGQALRQSITQEAADVEAETRKIDAALEVEERELTDLRDTMPPSDFRALALAFDTKVKNLRAEREAAAAALRDKEAAARQEFFSNVTQIIGDYMVEQGAVVILDKKAIIVSLVSLDITSEIIAQIDAKLGDGSLAP